MRRFWFGVIAGLLLVGLTAAPAGAAKGSTKISSVKGTFSGVVSVTVNCGWATWQDFMSGQQQPVYQPFTETVVTADALAVNASTLGRGAMSWNFVMSPVQGRGASSWSFVASNGASGLTAGNFNLNLGGMGGPMLSWNANQLIGTGKFAGVKQQSQLQTVNGVLVSQPDQSQCSPGDQPVDPVDTVTDSVGPVETTVSNVLFTGYLAY